MQKENLIKDMYSILLYQLSNYIKSANLRMNLFFQNNY